MVSGIDEKMLIARAQDVVSLCEKQNCLKVLGFLTPVEAELIRRNLPGTTVQTLFFGGYDEAERTLFVALPDYLDERDAEEIVSVVEICGRDIGSLRHPDFLGSLLGLGIKREKIGDILVLEDRCLVFVVPNIADYIAENLDKVGRKGVTVRQVELAQLEIPKRKVDRFHTTVSALRLDSVVAAAIRTSRSGANAVLAEGRVFVNWSQVDSPSFKIKPGDVLSVRGIGRFRVGEEVSKTKKDRISIYIEKFV